MPLGIPPEHVVNLVLKLLAELLDGSPGSVRKSGSFGSTHCGGLRAKVAH